MDRILYKASAVHSVTYWIRKGDEHRGDQTPSIAVDCCWKPPSTYVFRHENATPLQVADLFFSRRTHHPAAATGPSNTRELTSEICGSQAAFEFVGDCIRAAAQADLPRQARLLIPVQRGTIVRSDMPTLRLRDAFWADTVSSFSEPLRVFSGCPVDGATASVPELVRAAAGGVLVKVASSSITSGEHEDYFGGKQRSPCPYSDVEADFEDKLSIPWVAPVCTQTQTPPRHRRRRVVLVGSSQQDPSGGGWTQFAHRAAAALGIDLVILDRPGGWLAADAYAHWYEALLVAPDEWWTTDPSRRPGRMAGEIVSLVRSYIHNAEAGGGEDEKTIDGIVTFTEAFQVPVSMAASRLGLPHQSPTSYETATNKYKLGQSQDRPAVLVSSAEEALTAISTSAPESLGPSSEQQQQQQQQLELSFPVIVKPIFGLNSEGVSRVDRASELPAAIAKAHNSAGRNGDDNGTCDGGDNKVLVEPYCAGPEVDVNLVLVDGEVVFAEVCDDFPKVGDNSISTEGVPTLPRSSSPSASSSSSSACSISSASRSNFHETAMVYPSALPPAEISLLETAIADAIGAMGFTDGVMHVEARVANSCCEYAYTPQSSRDAGDETDVLDLQPRRALQEHQDQNAGDTTTPPPIPWIIEINPRPPGVFASQTPESVYGIDYWGISLALCLGDSALARSLSRPFASGPQMHAVLVMIRAEFARPPSRATTTDTNTTNTAGGDNEEEAEEEGHGIFDSDDVCAELLTRCPELTSHVGRRGCLLKRGQKIPHPSSSGRNTFVAYFNVFSRNSRREALEVAARVREEVRYTIR